MAWMNVDKPTKKLTIHLSRNTWVRRIRVTPWKGVGGLRRDGGWLVFGSRAGALAHGQANWPAYRVTFCP